MRGGSTVYSYPTDCTSAGVDLQIGTQMYSTDRISRKPTQMSEADIFWPIVSQDESINHLSSIATMTE